MANRDVALELMRMALALMDRDGRSEAAARLQCAIDVAAVPSGRSDPEHASSNPGGLEATPTAAAELPERRVDRTHPPEAERRS